MQYNQIITWYVDGQVGFTFKGIVYAVIGGLSCQSAVQGGGTIRGADNSPQVCTFLKQKYSTYCCKAQSSQAHHVHDESLPKLGRVSVHSVTIVAK